MCQHRDFTDMLVDQAKNRVLRLVVVDEVHLHVQQGMSFRGELRMLNDIFFRKVFGPTPTNLTPKAILATGTMISEYVRRAVFAAHSGGHYKASEFGEGSIVDTGTHTGSQQQSRHYS